MMKYVCLYVVVCLCLGKTVSANELNFKVHVIEKNSPLVNFSVFASTLVDLDNDGDLDWTVGTIWVKPRTQRTLYWYEYQGPDKWVKHKIGTDIDLYGGITSFDVDKDGRKDLLASNVWLNKGQGKWQLKKTGVGDGAHDLFSGDFNGDGKMDFGAFTQKGGLNWFEIKNEKWQKHSIGKFNYAGHKVHSTGAPKATGDLDGDGDVDIAAVHGWFENTDQKGTKWKYRKNNLFPSAETKKFPWGYGVKTSVQDIDGDGDLDIVQTESDTREPAGIVWLENSDGKGNFKLHWIKQRVPEDFHSLAVRDFDGDGDLDVLSGTGPLSSNKTHNLYIFENVKNSEGQIAWKKHIIFSGMPIHEAQADDVDGDGDVDIVIKPWNKLDSPKDFLYLQNQLKQTGR